MSGSELVPGDPGGSGSRIPPDARRQPAEQAPAAGEVMDIHGLVTILRRHLWLVAAATVLVSAFTANRVLGRVPGYRASGLFRMAVAGAPAPGRADEEVAKAIYGTGTSPLLSQLEFLRGREVLGEVVDRAGLRLQAAPGGLQGSGLSGVAVAVPPGESRRVRLAFDADGVQATSGGAVARARYGEPVHLPDVRFTVRSRPRARSAEMAIRPRDRAIDHLGSNLVTRLREKTDAVAVEYTSPDPELAQRVVNTAMLVFQGASANAARQEARRRRVVLEEQLRGGDSIPAEMRPQLRQELQRARVAEALEAGQVKIVHAAPLPSAAIDTGVPVKLALGVLMGLALGAGGALLKEGLSTSIRRQGEMERLLGVPALALVPRIAPRAGGLRQAMSRGSTAPDERREDSLATLHAARSPSAEAYRTLRTNLIFSRAARAMRVLAVTSPSPSEGKTTTAANLAVAYAQQGLRVAVVDCNLRKARLHQVFGTPREPGLTGLVLGHVPLDQALRESAVDRLHVMPAGVLAPNPSELLGGERMREILDLLSARFDLVILDTPPLLAAADASILATLADAVLVVVRAGQTDRGAAQRAIQQLSKVGANVVGAVLNDPDSWAPRDTYSHYGDE